MHTLDSEILALLSDGPATVAALSSAMGQPDVEVWRALTRLFAHGGVRPEGDVWRTTTLAAVSP